MDDTTATVARWAATFNTGALREESVSRARHAVLDWTGVAIAGAREPVAAVLTQDALENGEAGAASLVGRAEAVTPASAALINGAASHALDYDDVNSQMGGHPSAAVFPAVLALAEQHHLSGRALLEAFVVGYQVACSLGEMMGRSHYESGWHTTATVGTLGAATGTARLLGLDETRTAIALGIAATQAAGLKAMFGTMCKPLHAGKAAMNGLLAARWAAGGLDSNPTAIEAPQGFAHTQSRDFRPGALPAGPGEPLAVEAGLYKYHAACYLTHASIEALRSLRAEHDLGPDAVERVRLHVLPVLDGVCNIQAPASGLEVKFSLRHLAAMALHGIDTADLGSFTGEMAGQASVCALRDRVEVVFGEVPSRNAARVEVVTRDGGTLQASADVGVPHADTDAEWRKLESKFTRLVEPRLGARATGALLEAVSGLDELDDVGHYCCLTRPA